MISTAKKFTISALITLNIYFLVLLVVVFTPFFYDGLDLYLLIALPLSFLFLPLGILFIILALFVTLTVFWRLKQKPIVDNLDNSVHRKASRPANIFLAIIWVIGIFLAYYFFKAYINHEDDFLNSLNVFFSFFIILVLIIFHAIFMGAITSANMAAGEIERKPEKSRLVLYLGILFIVLAISVISRYWYMHTTCENWTNPYCITNKVAGAENYDFCEKPQEAWMKTSCYLSAGKKTGNYEFCQKAEDLDYGDYKEVVEDCYKKAGGRR